MAVPSFFQDQKVQIKAKIKPATLNSSNFAPWSVFYTIEKLLNGDVRVENFIVALRSIFLTPPLQIIARANMRTPYLPRQTTGLLKRGDLLPGVCACGSTQEI